MSAITQRSFAAGEIAPYLYARTDLARYFIGLRTCRNFIIPRQGGAMNRPGTTFRGEVDNSSKAVRLVPFVFNTAQTYVLEFGDAYMRVFKAGNQVMVGSAQTVSGITQASVGVVTYVGADNFTNGDGIIMTFTVQGSAGPYYHNRFFKVSNVNAGANTFELQDSQGNNINTTSYPAFAGSTATVDRVFKLVTPYAVADLPALVFAQSADTVVITHPTYAPQKLTRAADNSWAITSLAFTGDLFVNMTGFTNGGAAGTGTTWGVTVTSNETGEETIIQLETTSSAAPTSAAPITLTVTMLGGAPSLFGITTVWKFNFYRKINGVYGFIGSSSGAASSTFSDVGNTPDITNGPPEARNPFSTTGYYPSAVAYHQSRRIYGGTNTNPETVFGSKTGVYSNFFNKIPITDAAPVTFTMSGQQVNYIKHFLSMRKFLIFTTGGEWAVNGDASGRLTPAAINLQLYSRYGIGTLFPLMVQDTALFVQARSNIIRDLTYDFYIDSYHGSDLTVMAAHLFDNYTVADWAYAQAPNSIVWVARSDGALLGCTYIREQQMLAWHRHDLGGSGVVENVCVVPEGNEDILYLCVKRTINSKTVRYVERMESRNFTTVRDAIFMDATLSYNGTNSGSTTMTLSGGTNWTFDETLTLTANASTFLSTDVGARIDLTGSDGSTLRCVITAYTSATVVSVMPAKTVSATLQSIATATWTKAVKTVNGLWHLEGKTVSVYADSFVVGNPNNASFKTTYTVANGSITLDDPYGVIYVGLPIIADMETLDIDVQQGETLADKKKLITKVVAFVQNSRGLWAGPNPPTSDTSNPLENLEELQIRNTENYESPVSLATDNVEIPIMGDYNNNGRAFIRQVDPLPLSILSLTPVGYVPYPGTYQP